MKHSSGKNESVNNGAVKSCAESIRPLKKKGLLQKTSMAAGIFCQIIALFCLVMTYLESQTLGMEDVITASYLASTFFFSTCGIVMIIIGKADLPDLSISGLSEDK